MTAHRYTTRTVRNAMARMADSMTSFDETAVAAPQTLIDLKSVYPVSRLRDRIRTVGGASVTQADGRYAVSVEADGSAEAEFTSVERARYVAGYDGVPGMGVNLDRMPTGGQVVEWGNTDFQNGFVVGVDAQGFFTRLYRAGVAVTTRRRALWSYGRDAELSPLDVHVYRMPYRWYASGPFRLLVDFIGADGRPTMLPLDLMGAEDRTRPITEDPNQPLNIRVLNNGTAAPLTAYVMGRQYLVMGDYNPNRRLVGDFRIEQTVGETFVPLIAFSQKSGAYESISIKLAGAGLISSSNLLWEIRTYAELTGGTWRTPRHTDDGVESAVDVNTGATAVEGGVQLWVGDPVAGGQGSASGAGRQDLPEVDLPLGPVVLCARAVSGTATVTSAFRVREDW